MSQKWFYFVHKDGNAIAKVNTDAFRGRMEAMGFYLRTRAEWLETQKTLRAGHKIEFDIVEDRDANEK